MTCPDCRALEPGQKCIYCHQEEAQREQERFDQAMEDAHQDDVDWSEHKEWCVPCRRNSGVIARAILRARCPRYKEWGGPKP